MKTNYLINGVAAVAVMFLFAQCAGKTETKLEGQFLGSCGYYEYENTYVEIDTLLTQYNFWNEFE